MGKNRSGSAEDLGVQLDPRLVSSDVRIGENSSCVRGNFQNGLAENAVEEVALCVVRRSEEVAGAKVVAERVAALLDGNRLEKRGRVLGTEFLGVLGDLVQLQCSANVARNNVTSGPRRLGSGREGGRDGDGCGGAGGSAAQGTADDPLEVSDRKASAHSVHVQHASGVSANDSAEEVGHRVVRHRGAVQEVL